MCQLILPSVNYKDSYLEAVLEFQQERRNNNINHEKLSSDFESYIKEQIGFSKGENLPYGFIPFTNFWLIDKFEFIGFLVFRHYLTDKLKKEGGHIGYEIRPSKRKMGYGKKILELGLVKVKEAGIEKALITCNEDNLASRKIIEYCGGEFIDKVKLENQVPLKLRFWVKTSK